MIDRLGRAAADVFTRPALYWTVAVLVGLQRLVFTVVAPRRYDAEGMWEGAHAYLTNPAHMYDAASDYLARLHIIAPPGGLDAFVSPPPVALLGVPVALLPRSVGVQVWTAIDAAAVVLALVFLYRVLASKDRLARPIFWLTAAYFPPLFADLSAGQRGGVLLVLAMASVWFERGRPSVAGALGGLAAAIKYYPAAMIIGPRPAHRIRYALVLFVVLVLVTAATFIPLGLGGTLFYYQHVLLPSLGSHNPDCAYDSVRTLFMRTIGGEPFAVPSSTGYEIVTSPLHFAGVALALSYASAVLFGAGAAWAAWRSGWNPAYGMALGFSLGALIPNEVWPYQWLPLLPIGLILTVRAIERRRAVTLALLGLCLVGFWRQPCELFFPNIWTMAGIGIFVLAVWENRLFRSERMGEVRMALNADVSFTWVGHGTWKVRSAKGKEILIDPWVMNNPAAPETLKTVDKCDLMLITHGHFDHIHDALEIARRTKCTIVTNHEIGVWLGSKGIDGEYIVAGNQGGTIEAEGIRVTLVHAEHSCGITEDGHLIYGGEACGLVIEFENGFTIYFAGDTDVFGDMALIAELSNFDVAFLPIGDFYTMGPERAAKAVKLLGVKTVVPMHFATFPILTGRPSQLQELVGPGVRVLDVKPGDTV